jgi:hypothetical protein
MGTSLAGDCGRLTLFRGRSAALLFNLIITRRPAGIFPFEEIHHAR